VSAPAPRVGLLVTCLADMFRPQIGFAAASLIERAGCVVDVPPQSCCGQPSFNGGDAGNAKALARNVITAFEAYDYVVVPSGSCAGMVHAHYPELLNDDVSWKARAEALAAKTYELFDFLVNVRGLETVATAFSGVVAYHDSCSSLRENGVSREPRILLAGVEGLELRDVPETDICCGFGGLFSVKYPEISARMADDKIAAAKSTGSEMMTGGDFGCLLHLVGRCARKGETLRMVHAAEILAGLSGPAIGEDTP